jgi:hypothetical protein
LEISWAFGKMTPAARRETARWCEVVGSQDITQGRAGAGP